MDSQMKQIVRERQTEERIRAMDAPEIVDEIHALEYRIAELEAVLPVDYWELHLNLRHLQSRIEAGLNLADEWDKQIAGCDDPYYEGLPNKWQADQLREALEARDE